MQHAHLKRGKRCIRRHFLVFLHRFRIFTALTDEFKLKIFLVCETRTDGYILWGSKASPKTWSAMQLERASMARFVGKIPPAHAPGSHHNLLEPHNGALCAPTPAAAYSPRHIYTEPWVNTERRLGMQPAAERKIMQAFRSEKGERCKYYANTVRLRWAQICEHVRYVVFVHERGEALRPHNPWASCVCFCSVMSMRARESPRAATLSFSLEDGLKILPIFH